MPFKTIGIGLGWLTAYTLAVAALGMLLYKDRFLFAFVIPIFTEIVLIKSIWTSSAFWCGFLARFLGLIIARILVHYFYVIPIIYGGEEPWADEYVDAYSIVIGQAIFAGLILLIIKKLLRTKMTGVGLGWLTAYTLFVAALQAPLVQVAFVIVFITPIIAESILIKSVWTTSAFWFGFLARFLGLTIAWNLVYYFYVIPIIYGGREPWPEESVWLCLIIGMQASIAGITLLMIKKLLPKSLKQKRAGS